MLESVEGAFIRTGKESCEGEGEEVVEREKRLSMEERNQRVVSDVFD